jgi:hypothetical protein
MVVDPPEGVVQSLPGRPVVGACEGVLVQLFHAVDQFEGNTPYQNTAFTPGKRNRRLIPTVLNRLWVAETGYSELGSLAVESLAVKLASTSPAVGEPAVAKELPVAPDRSSVMKVRSPTAVPPKLPMLVINSNQRWTVRSYR